MKIYDITESYEAIRRNVTDDRLLDLDNFEDSAFVIALFDEITSDDLIDLMKNSSSADKICYVLMEDVMFIWFNMSKDQVLKSLRSAIS